MQFVVDDISVYEFVSYVWTGQDRIEYRSISSELLIPLMVV